MRDGPRSQRQPNVDRCLLYFLESGQAAFLRHLKKPNPNGVGVIGQCFKGWMGNYLIGYCLYLTAETWEQKLQSPSTGSSNLISD